MAKPNEEEGKSDGLEITSIGSLYKGPWDKKYWSSSRGKDRYPYPVEYQAVRSHNGSTYKMEIHEGPKGPSFVITSADGHSCSGTTPNIVWAKFQKKGSPGTKIWHGKRFSCKIDGVEFFGFKNPFVQRLLRELVANINGTAEQSLLSSSFCNEASTTEHDNRCPDTCTYPDLLPYSAKPHIRKRRSRRCEIINTKLVCMAGLKRPRPQDLTHNAEASNSVQGNKRNHKHGSFPASEKENDSCELPGVFSASVPLKSVVGEENGHLLAKDVFTLKSVDFSDHVRERAVPAQEKGKLARSKNCKTTRVASNSSKEVRLFDRSQDTEVEGKAGDAPIPTDSLDIHDAPDTFDFVQDNATNEASSTQDKGTDSVKEEEINAAEIVNCEGLMTESHPEEEICTSDSNASSGKSDFDSVGQVMAKSMMKFLLPQAIPLLKRASVKKKESCPLEILPYRVTSQEENNETSRAMNFPSPEAMLYEETHMEREEKTHIKSIDLDSVVPSFEHTNSVIPDSFEDDQFGDHVTNPVMLSSNIVETDRASFGKDTYPPNVQEQLVSVDVQKESSVCQVEISESKDIFCYDELHMAFNEKPQEGNVCINESVLGCLSPSKKVFSEEIQDACASLEENSVGDLNIAPDCTKVVDINDANLRGMGNSVQLTRKGFSVETGALETGSFNEVNKVYTRKKVPNITLSTKKYTGPLSEGIIRRNFGDDCVPQTYPATETLLASDIHQISSSDDKRHKKDLHGADAGLGGQSCGQRLHTEKTSTNCKAVPNSLAPIISQNQTFVCSSECKDTSNYFDPSVSFIEKYQAHFDKELVGHEKLVNFNSSTLSQKQGTSFCDNNTSSVKEAQPSLDLKPHKHAEFNSELEDIVELVGCYLHPMPVSSLFFSTKGNEIYICVLCGHLVEKDRALFIYKVAIKEPRLGCPSFVGHASVTLPLSEDKFGREIALERSLQFTPDGQCLVLLDSIKTPNCREGRVDCLCSTCTSYCFEENAVKIVHVKSGYVSIVAKLQTVEIVQCILVCDPDLLVVVGESGRLHLWAMNSTWSAQTEEFDMPTDNCVSPCIIELKRIPKCATLVVGHNGFGEFSVWDIAKRVFVSRFSAPNTSIYQFFPISLFGWQGKGPVFSHSDVKEYIDGIAAAEKICFSEHSGNHSIRSLEGENIAVWLLVSTVPDLDAQHNYVPSDCQTNPAAWWRLALLVKNTVILGNALDPRATCIGASAGHGIIGTHDGLVYMWELSTGTKLGTLHHFKGGSVTCVATDDSRSGVLAVAGDGGQLRVYLHHQKNVANQ